MNITPQQLSNTILAWQISALVAMVIAGAITFGLLYLVIRAGVRDGMRDALASSRPGKRYTAEHLPDMRAD